MLGLRPVCQTEVLRVADVTGEPTADADLVVVGGPTHAHGYTEIADPAGFLVDKHNALLDGELGRAEEWGRQLAEATAGAATVPGR